MHLHIPAKGNIPKTGKVSVRATSAGKKKKSDLPGPFPSE